MLTQTILSALAILVAADVLPDEDWTGAEDVVPAVLEAASADDGTLTPTAFSTADLTVSPADLKVAPVELSSSHEPPTRSWFIPLGRPLWFSGSVSDLEGLPDERYPVCYFQAGSLWLGRSNADRLQIGQVVDTTTGLTVASRTTDDIGYQMHPSFRLLLGYRMDAIRSIEVLYFGCHTSPTQASLGTATVMQPIFSNFLNFGIIPITGTATQDYRYVSRLNNLEVDLRRLVRANERASMSVLTGVRFLSIREDLNISQSFSIPPLAGERTRVNIRNRYVGVHTGAKVEKYHGPFMVGANAGLGLFAAIAGLDATSRVAMTDGTGNVVVNNSADETDVAGIIDLGLMARIVVRPSLALEFGYQAMIVTTMGLAPEQLTRNFGTTPLGLVALPPDLDNNAVEIYHGPSASVHMRW